MVDTSEIVISKVDEDAWYHHPDTHGFFQAQEGQRGC